jgi:hypothetical protein
VADGTTPSTQAVQADTETNSFGHDGKTLSNSRQLTGLALGVVAKFR